jgi:deazaflavin-dependent oxidoreductase (nitroreductase family)
MGAYHRLIDAFLRTDIGGWTALNVMNPLDTRMLKWSNGKLSTGIGTEFHPNVVLLRCTGAKTGRPRDIPLLAAPLDDGWVLIASATGKEHNPGWYYNLKAHPHCALLVPNRGEVSCTAREAEGADRERAWEAANAQFSGYEGYQQRTERTIPVVILDPRQ